MCLFFYNMIKGSQSEKFYGKYNFKVETTLVNSTDIKGDLYLSCKKGDIVNIIFNSKKNVPKHFYEAEYKGKVGFIPKSTIVLERLYFHPYLYITNEIEEKISNLDLSDKKVLKILRYSLSFKLFKDYFPYPYIKNRYELLLYKLAKKEIEEKKYLAFREDSPTTQLWVNYVKSFLNLKKLKKDCFNKIANCPLKCFYFIYIITDGDNDLLNKIVNNILFLRIIIPKYMKRSFNSSFGKRLKNYGMKLINGEKDKEILDFLGKIIPKKNVYFVGYNTEPNIIQVSNAITNLKILLEGKETSLLSLKKDNHLSEELQTRQLVLMKYVSRKKSI